MSNLEDENEICYAALAFHTDSTSGSNAGGLPSKLLNRNNSKKELWSARRTPSIKQSSFKKSVYKDDDDEDPLSALPEMRLPAPPPPRTHSNAVSQTDENDEKESPWKERQKPLLVLGLVGFVCFAIVMNLVVYDLYIQKDDSSADDWCEPLSKTDVLKSKPMSTIKIATVKLTTVKPTTTKPTTTKPTTTKPTTTIRTTAVVPVKPDICKQFSNIIRNVQTKNSYTHNNCGPISRTKIILLHRPVYICTINIHIKQTSADVGRYNPFPPTRIQDYGNYLEVSYLTNHGYPSKRCETMVMGHNYYAYSCNATTVSDRFILKVKWPDIFQNVQMCKIKVRGIETFHLKHVKLNNKFMMTG